MSFEHWNQFIESFKAAQAAKRRQREKATATDSTRGQDPNQTHSAEYPHTATAGRSSPEAHTAEGTGQKPANTEKHPDALQAFSACLPPDRRATSAEGGK